MPDEVKNYLISIVKQQIDHRESNNITRKDFIQILIQLRNTGEISIDDTNWDVTTSSDEHTKTMSIEQCAAQVFLFYVAGYDTSASTIAYAVFELAQNQEIMRKLQMEITECLEQHNGNITYECIQSMTYMDACLMEVIRKYPALPILNRECTIDYKVPDSHLTIRKGTAIVISLLGMARDPENFPDPETYDPNRFITANPEYNEAAYIPFGYGPRACIGLRLGNLMAKIGLIHLLMKYDFTPLDSKQLEFDNFAVGLVVKGGIRLAVSNRKR